MGESSSKFKGSVQMSPRTYFIFKMLWNKFKCIHLLNKLHELFAHTILWIFHVQMKLMKSNIYNPMLQSKVVAVRATGSYCGMSTVSNLATNPYIGPIIFKVNLFFNKKTFRISLSYLQLITWFQRILRLWN